MLLGTARLLLLALAFAYHLRVDSFLVLYNDVVVVFSACVAVTIET